MTPNQWRVYHAFREAFVAFPEARISTEARGGDYYRVRVTAQGPAGDMIVYQGEVPRMSLWSKDTQWELPLFAHEVARNWRERWVEEEQMAAKGPLPIGTPYERERIDIGAELRRQAAAEALRLLRKNEANRTWGMLS